MSQRTRSAYELFERVGSGATATVFKCLRTRDDKVFACKIVDSSTIGERRALSEVNVLYKLNGGGGHANVVPLIDAIQDVSLFYLIMPLMECSLDTAITEPDKLGAKFEEQPLMRSVFEQVVKGLEHVHKEGIVHRDLKPANVLMSRDPVQHRQDIFQVKITDLGHSTYINGLRPAQTKIGTPMFWAPEVNLADITRLEYTETVDLWSLGVTLYVMVRGSYIYELEEISNLILGSSPSSRAARTRSRTWSASWSR